MEGIAEYALLYDAFRKKPAKKKLSFYISNVILREHHVNLWVRQHPEEKYIFAILDPTE